MHSQSAVQCNAIWQTKHGMAMQAVPHCYGCCCCPELEPLLFCHSRRHHPMLAYTLLDVHWNIVSMCLGHVIRTLTYESMTDSHRKYVHNEFNKIAIAFSANFTNFPSLFRRGLIHFTKNSCHFNKACLNYKTKNAMSLFQIFYVIGRCGQRTPHLYTILNWPKFLLTFSHCKLCIFISTMLRKQQQFLVWWCCCIICALWHWCNTVTLKFSELHHRTDSSWMKKRCINSCILWPIFYLHRKFLWYKQ